MIAAAPTYPSITGRDIARDFAGRLAIVTYVGSQFIDFSFGSVGPFALSVQKIGAAIVFPYALLLLRRVRWSPILGVFASLLFLAFAAGNIVGPYASTKNLVSAVASVALGLLGAVALLTFLAETRSGFRFFARAWIAAGVLTAALCVGQAIGALPLITVASDSVSHRVAAAGLYRATGLKYDPNFQALMLVIAVALARIMTTPRWRPLVQAGLLLGVLATFSRAGLVVSVFILVGAPLVERRTLRMPAILALRRVFAAAFCVAVALVGAYALSPGVIRTYAVERVHDAERGLMSIGGDPGGSTTGNVGSADERVLLNRGALRLFREHPLTGIGAFNGPDALGATVGIRKAAHNTALESVMTGGFLGALAVLGYILLMRRALAPSEDERLGLERAAIVASALGFGFMTLFLTVDYNAILWLPLVLAGAYALQAERDRARRFG